MKRVLCELWAGEAGFVVSTELILIATILVIGLIAGLTTLRDQVVQELGDVADAISSINQSYSFSGVTGHTSSTSGSRFGDLSDFCDELPSVSTAPECLSVVIDAPLGE